MAEHIRVRVTKIFCMLLKFIWKFAPLGD